MSDEINKRLKELKTSLSATQLAKIAYPTFKAVTPIRSGNARLNTELKADNIEANYPYAGRLDDGYSKQAPRGMTAPTIRTVQEYIRKTNNGN